MEGFNSEGKLVKLKNVIYAKDVAKNLILSHKFVDRGLSVYLDGKIINVFDPKTKQTFLTGNYKKPF